MSEALTPPANPATVAASLYPADGGAGAAALAGQDTTAAPAGADTVAGAAGTDTLVGGQGADTVVGGQGTDTVAAGAGNDTLVGGQGADSISAPEYDFKLPTGFVEDAALTTEAKAVFAAAGVPADKAQGLVDLFGKAMKASTDAQAAAHATEQQAWLTELQAMPEFTGPTRETSTAALGRLFDEFGTPEAKAALNSHGVGNNPALVKMMLKIASTVLEGAPAGLGRPIGLNGAQRGAPKTLGGALYPDGGAGPAKN